MTKTLLPLIPLLSLALFAQTPAPQPPPAAVPARPMPVPPKQAEEPKDGDIIAYLGKREIRYGDFSGWLKLMAGPRSEMIRRNPTSRNQAMKQYLDLQVMAAKGRQENLQNTKEFKDLNAAMAQQVYYRVIMDEDRPGSEGQKLKEKAENPSDAEMQAYFKANSERYATTEKFTARHILVSIKGAPGAGDKGLPEPEAKEKILKLQAEIKAGKSFEDVAKESSDDPGSKANGGLYKDIPFGRFAKEFEEAVRTQEIGKLGDPVKTNFGYHLILVESRTPKQPGDFEKSKDAVRKAMIPERKDKLNKEFMEATRKAVGFKEVPQPQPEMNQAPMMPAASAQAAPKP